MMSWPGLTLKSNSLATFEDLLLPFSALEIARLDLAYQNSRFQDFYCTNFTRVGWFFVIDSSDLSSAFEV